MLIKNSTPFLIKSRVFCSIFIIAHIEGSRKNMWITRFFGESADEAAQGFRPALISLMK